MRIIKFRGISKKTKNWIYGGVSIGKIKSRVHGFEVIPESIGQFTGLLDKNSKDIFEGDCDDRGNVVVFENGMFLLKGKNGFNRYLSEQNKFIEIIGTTFENPELMDVQNDKTTSRT